MINSNWIHFMFSYKKIILITLIITGSRSTCIEQKKSESLTKQFSGLVLNTKQDEKKSACRGHEYGKAPHDLNSAIQSNCPECCEKFITDDIDPKDLYLAVTKKSPKVVEVLLINGADANHLYPIYRFGRLREQITFLEDCISRIAKKPKFFNNIKLLLEYGANPNHETHESPLHIWCERNGNPELTTMLLFHGARTDKRNEYGEIPLLSAVNSDSFNNVKVLLEWPYRLAQARTLPEQIKLLHVFDDKTFHTNMLLFLIIDKRNSIKLPKPIIYLIIKFMIDWPPNNELAQLIWTSDNPEKTAQEYVQTMITTQDNKGWTALKPHEFTKKQSKKVRILLEQYLNGTQENK